MSDEALTILNPKLAEAVAWLLTNPPQNTRIAVLRERFGPSAIEICRAWRLAAEKRS